MGHRDRRRWGSRAGFTHMEWYRKADGEVVFGEIGARPPGARTVDMMNYATDARPLPHLGLAIIDRAPRRPLTRPLQRRQHLQAGQGSGRITRVEGLERLIADLGEHVRVVDLLPIGAPRRDWRATLLSDGMIIYRHPDLQEALRIGDRFARELQLYAE